MRVHIRHQTRYAYTPAATRAALRMKLYPSRFATQTPISWSVRVNGEPVSPLIVNGYGDSEAIWATQAALEGLEVIAEGMVDVSDAAGVIRGLHEAARAPVFLRTTPLTKPDAAIKALSAGAVRETALETLHALNAAVRDAMEYVTGSSHAGMAAAEALAQGRGVCQDQAHVFIAAARALEIPARYVVGYLAAGPLAQNDTHAWAEGYVPELGWVGFDPANRQCPTDVYVRLASGFDAADAAPMRGCVSTTGQEALTAHVEISSETAQHQRQEQ